MRKKLKILLCDIDYIFLNYFVANIPCWYIRKILYLLHGMKIGAHSRINMKCIVYAPWKISIGSNTIVNEYALLDGRGRLYIKDNVSISMYSMLYSASHYSWSSTFEYYTKETVVGSGCWIGAKAIVLPGSKLEENTIIGANSVIKGVTVANGIYCGNPAKYSSERQFKGNISINTVMFFK